MINFATSLQSIEEQKGRPLRIKYAIQNVGGIDFTHDIGDTVPVKQSLLGLQRAGHEVVCLQLNNRSVIEYKDLSSPENGSSLVLGISGARPFRWFESGIRRFQRMVGLPYLALFDSLRFYDALIRTLPGADLCHEHNGLFCIGAALACRRLNLPYILTFSADPFYERALGGRQLRGLSRLIATWEARYTYRLAKKIVCVSQAAREHLIKTWQVNPDKVVVMPNGVDLDLFRPDYDACAIRTELGLNDELVVGFVGGFQHWHGLELLVESLAQIRVHIPDAKLLLVGDGRARSSVEAKIAEQGLESAVIITGLVPQKRVPQFLAAIDVAVLPYPQLPRELWFSPLKLYEYMAAGKAIVASNSGQISEVIENEDTGLLVQPGNVKELSQSIIRLLHSPAERSRLGGNALNQALSQHSWDQYTKRLEKIYLSVLSENI